jgi:hypothetical protein
MMIRAAAGETVEAGQAALLDSATQQMKQAEGRM